MEAAVPARRTTGRRSLRSLIAVAAVASGALGLAGCGSQASIPPPLTRTAMQSTLATPVAGTKPAVAKLEKEAGTVLPDAPSQAKKVLARELAALRGTPVVVTLWGEWCPPCIRETPILQRTALALRGKVAFLGVATLSSRSRTVNFLDHKMWLPYPSILDDGGQIIQTTGLQSPPQTLFYSPTGKRFVHLGGYSSVADLETDIKRYTA